MSASNLPPLRRIHLSVVIPMYNEARRIGGSLRTMRAWLSTAPFTSEILAIDDGSRDRGSAIARDLLSRLPQGNLLRGEVVTHPCNRGKGAAIRTGFCRAHGEWLLTYDADASTPIGESLRLLAIADQTQAALVLGSRSVPGAKIRALPHRIVAGRIFQWFAAREGFRDVRDSQCGFKLYRADLAAMLARTTREDGYLVDLEHLAVAKAAGFKFVEIGVRWSHRFGSKVQLLRDGPRMLRDLRHLRTRLNNPGSLSTEPAK